MAIIFWLCTATIVYTYVVYPLLLLAIGRLRPRTVVPGIFRGTVSIVMAVRDEAPHIAARRDALLAQLDATGLQGELIVISDGSIDDTARRARLDADSRVCVIEMPRNVGKAECLTRGAAAAVGDVLVFADVRQRWAVDAMSRLLGCFADPSIGGVSGELCLEQSPGLAGGFGLYWRYEKCVRHLESRAYSAVGVTGAISAVRRSLFRPIPSGTILDDVYWPMQVVAQGYRVVHEARALAFDRLPPKPRDEFRRKVRTLSGNLQLAARSPVMLLPWRNPVWAQFISHKLLRLAVPWLMIGMLVSSALIDSTLFRAALIAQIGCYALAMVGLNNAFARRSRVLSAASSFIVLNAAAWLAFWVWISGRSTRTWCQISYAAASAMPRPDPAPVLRR